MNVTLRDAAAGDLDEVLALNEANVPAVGQVSIEKMHWFRDHAHYFRVAVTGDYIAAFLIGLRPGTSYESSNYRWFCDNYEDFAYVDRIAVSERARRSGLASRLYDDFAAAMAEAVVMTCEVNILPPNPSSMRFHERLGFRRVGTIEYEPGAKEVALLELRL
ncbi:MAG: GNAT family N-acetyltransferase [Woeseiaceae bacterium]|nr:GNAT family N-acetyltransferase [Woeseiaceae bacterium]